MPKKFPGHCTFLDVEDSHIQTEIHHVCITLLSCNEPFHSTTSQSKLELLVYQAEPTFEKHPGDIILAFLHDR